MERAREHAPAPSKPEEEPRVSIEDAEGEAIDSVLAKPDLARGIEQLEGSEEIKEKLQSFQGYGRDKYHLLRMLDLKRSEAEQLFARAYLENLESVKVDIDDESALELALEQQTRAQDIDQFAELLYGRAQVIGGEGVDTKMWWTFAPYVFEALQEKGIEPQKAVRMLVEWTDAAAEDYKYDEEPNTLHLPGLEDLNINGRARTYVLSSNERGPTHVFTKQKSQDVVRQLMK